MTLISHRNYLLSHVGRAKLIQQSPYDTWNFPLAIIGKIYDRAYRRGLGYHTWYSLYIYNLGEITLGYYDENRFIGDGEVGYLAEELIPLQEVYLGLGRKKVKVNWGISAASTVYLRDHKYGCMIGVRELNRAERYWHRGEWHGFE